MKRFLTSDILIPAALLVVDAVVFGGSDPQKVPSMVLIVAFLLLTATFYFLARGLIKAAGWYGIKTRHPGRLAAVITVVTAVIMALQSTGELTGRDILVLLPFVVIGYLYASYGSKRQNSRS